MSPYFFGAVGRIQKEGRPVLSVGQHVKLLEEGKLVTCDEVRLINEVRALDRLLAEAEMAHCARPGLLGVVDEVALRVVVGVLSDNLDGVLVRPNRTVGAEAVEQGAVEAFVRRAVVLVPGKAGVGDIVINADGEVILRRGLFEIVQHSLCHAGVELVGAEAVTSADDRGAFGERRGPFSCHGVDCGDHI